MDFANKLFVLLNCAFDEAYGHDAPIRVKDIIMFFSELGIFPSVQDFRCITFVDPRRTFSFSPPEFQSFLKAGWEKLHRKLSEARFAARVASKIMARHGIVHQGIWRDHVLPFLSVFKALSELEGIGQPSDIVDDSFSSEADLSHPLAEPFLADHPPWATSMPFDEVVHSEPEAEIGPLEAAEIVALQEADFVKRSIDSGLPLELEAQKQGAVRPECVYLLHLNRAPKAAIAALAEGTCLQACRMALTSEGHNWKLPSGAMIFVQPWQYRQVMSALNGRDLKSSQVVVAAEFEYLVAEAIASAGAWAKSRVALELTEVSVSAEASTTDDNAVAAMTDELSREFLAVCGQLEVRRTFLCAVPLPEDSTPVAQSTTEAVSNHGVNPRKSFFWKDCS
jgi:hypothetical protein